MALTDNFADLNYNVSQDAFTLTMEGKRYNASTYSEIEELGKYIQHKTFEFCALHINIHSVPDKFDNLKCILARLQDGGINVDFILLCETFLTDQNCKKYSIPGYQPFYQNRKIITKGGVAIYISHKFTANEREELSVNMEGEFESIIVDVQTKNKKRHIAVGEVYRIPGTNEKDSIQRYEQLFENIEQAKFTDVIIGTDQNIDLLKVNVNHNVELFLSTLLSHNVIPLATLPTRITHTSATLIDNIYVSQHFVDQMFTAILQTDISDHLPVLSLIGQPTITKQNTKSLTFRSRSLTDEKLGQVKQHLAQLDWDFLHELSVHEMYEHIIININQVLDQYAPERDVKIPSKHVIRDPWMTKGLMKSCKTRDKLYRKQHGKAKTHTAYLKFVEFRNTYNKLKRVAKQTYYKDKLENYKNDMRQTWKLVTSVAGKSND